MTRQKRQDRDSQRYDMNMKYLFTIMVALVCLIAGCRTQHTADREPDIVAKIRLTDTGDGPQVYLAGCLVSWEQLPQRLERLHAKYPDIVVVLGIFEKASATALNDVCSLLASQGLRRVVLLSSEARDSTQYLGLEIKQVEWSDNNSVFVFPDETGDRELTIPRLPERPVVAWSHLEGRHGRFYSKGTTNLFTGRAVSYPNYFYPDCIVDGRKLDLMAVSNNPKNIGPDAAPYQDALRDYVQEHGPGHNEYIFFCQHGRESDIPALLYGLKSMGETTNSAIGCTRAHCLEALQSVTGAKPGINYSDWAKWWKAKYDADPPEWKPTEE